MMIAPMSPPIDLRLNSYSLLAFDLASSQSCFHNSWLVPDHTASSPTPGRHVPNLASTTHIFPALVDAAGAARVVDDELPLLLRMTDHGPAFCSGTTATSSLSASKSPFSKSSVGLHSGGARGNQARIAIHPVAHQQSRIPASRTNLPNINDV